ncbi:MAG: hypothetical protein FWB85_02140 [Chitinispirillia bacterium]|nr:hypothetical protein [Chitinispirillia bacterium]MCL2241206.1 hypothetical protein [Chitinispirillia bacterium]
MTELTLRLIEDFMPYLKPEGREAHRNSVLKSLEVSGEVVKIEDIRSADGSRVLERIYHQADGFRSCLNAARMGVKSLEPMGELAPA